ncbi:MAG: DUF1854 domain-containing protein [Armatimonadota bacterium]|nr:DUF1854 domain-containing protein [Armatimonadota bacterium]MCX7777157.1 DUF1854 domain-containing protein [Armatimonadota bacterium]MDW8024984.1 DUF1854 domain-containing protein [Armatimonadota bacterium]
MRPSFMDGDIEPELEIRWLDECEVRFERGEDSDLWLICGGQKIKVGRLVRLLPLTDKSHYISVLDANGNEVGIIKDLQSIEPSSRSILWEELERIYFMPKIKRVYRIRHEKGSGGMIWEVETDVGRMKLRIPTTDNIHKSRYPRIFIVDEDGKRYEIPNCDALDSRSRRLLARYF